MTGILARRVTAGGTRGNPHLDRVSVSASSDVGAVVMVSAARGSCNWEKVLSGRRTGTGRVYYGFIPVGPGQLQSQGIVADDGTFAMDETGWAPTPGEYKVEIRCAKTGRRVPSMSSSDGTGMIDERVPVIPSKLADHPAADNHARRQRSRRV
ncbi:MAG: hypothetical protein U0792_02675 [Gemmataceae bacterium]